MAAGGRVAAEEEPGAHLGFDAAGAAAVGEGAAEREDGKGAEALAGDRGLEARMATGAQGAGAENALAEDLLFAAAAAAEPARLRGPRPVAGVAQHRPRAGLETIRDVVVE